MSILAKYLCVLGIATLPILELRGAIVWGVVQGLPLLPVMLVSIIGNMAPVPFIIKFIRTIFDWMKNKSMWLRRIAEKLESRANSKKDLIVKYEMWGLFILVAIPLPGTGAWTGSLVAALFDLRLKNAVPVIFAGTVAAGLIVSALTYGVDMLFSI